MASPDPLRVAAIPTDSRDDLLSDEDFEVWLEVMKCVVVLDKGRRRQVRDEVLQMLAEQDRENART